MKIHIIHLIPYRNINLWYVQARKEREYIQILIIQILLLSI